MRLHDMTPGIISFTTSHLAKETNGYNIMSVILTNFSEFDELRSSSTPFLLNNHLLEKNSSWSDERLHDMTPRTTSFAASHLAKETKGYNINF
jgi:hypothetical protein